MPDRPGVTRFVPLAVVACALVLGVLAVSRERHAIADALGDLRWWSIPASFAAYVVGLLAIFRSWLVLLDHTGSKVSARSARRVYLVGQAGKYLPGSIWSVISQVQLGREYGISRVRMASASLVALAVSVTVALSLGCVLLPFSDDEALARYWFALPVAAAFVFLLWQPVLNLGVGLAARVTRVRIDHTYRGGAIAASAGWAGLANLFFGVHIFAIAQSLGVRDVRGYILSTCAYALAAGLGVVIVIAPAGAGVREAVMVAVLAPVLTFGQALTVALLSRVVATVVDLGAALAQLRGRRRHSTQAEPVFLTRRFATTRRTTASG